MFSFYRCIRFQDAWFHGKYNVVNKWIDDFTQKKRHCSMQIKVVLESNYNLKLYCGYKYTRPCMINRVFNMINPRYD